MKNGNERQLRKAAAEILSITPYASDEYAREVENVLAKHLGETEWETEAKRIISEAAKSIQAKAEPDSVEKTAGIIMLAKGDVFEFFYENNDRVARLDKRFFEYDDDIARVNGEEIEPHPGPAQYVLSEISNLRVYQLELTFEYDTAQIELPGQAVMVWMRHRKHLSTLPPAEREAAWKLLCAKTEEVGKLKNARVWLKRAIAEEDARRQSRGE